VGTVQRDFYLSKVRLFVLSALLVVLIIGFTAAVIVMASNPEGNSFEILFFGAVILLLVFCLYFLVKNFSQKEANVTVSDLGLTVRGSGGPGFIPWEEIDGMFPYQVHNNAFLGIILKDEEKYMESLPKNNQRLAKINIKTGFPAFNIGLSNLKHKKELVELLTEIQIPFYVESRRQEPADKASRPKETDLPS
jgi:hypothetical protein